MSNYESRKEMIQNKAQKSSTGNALNVTYNELHSIEDTTDKNIEQAISNNYRSQALEDQQRLWEREDAIRKHIEEREDSAWQRSVEDAKKAGINPNLINLTPAASGSGINTGTGIDYTMQQKVIERETEKILKEMEQEFNIKENQKDRWGEFIRTLLTGLLDQGLSIGISAGGSD